jgi:8-oxo-dGTP diphosphatase
MNRIIDITRDDDVRQLATKSDILAGHEIVKQGEVAFGAFRPDKIEATVKAPITGTRSTLFELKNDTLTWKCTCTSDPKHFCKHLVATALEAQRKGRGDIYKAAGVLVKDRKTVLERSMGKPAFVSPGGRIEPDETAEQALVRELKEEMDIDVNEADLEPFGTYTATAANHPGQQVHMQVFLVKKWQGEIKPANEVEELRWFTSDLPADIEIGSIFVHEIMPELKKRDLVD